MHFDKANTAKTTTFTRVLNIPKVEGGVRTLYATKVHFSSIQCP